MKYQKRYFPAEEVRAAAQGNWLSILLTLAPHLEPAIQKPGRHTACPVHGGTDGFRLFKDAHVKGGGICNTCGAKADGISLLMWANDWSYLQALEQVAGLLGVEPKGQSGRSAGGEPVDQAKIAKVQSFYQQKPWLAELKREMEARLQRDLEYGKQLAERMEKLWDTCIALSDAGSAIGRMYLNKRGLTVAKVSSDALRFHPALPYYEDGTRIGEFPALVAAIRDHEGKMVTLHRTYLSDSGSKAKIRGGTKSTKKMMPVPAGLDIKGAAIRLSDQVGEVLGISEGVETALSCSRATGIPTWAAISALLMEHVEVPASVKLVVIWADKDRSETGELSAFALQRKLASQGVQSVIALPSMDIPAGEKGLDWNDVLIKHGRRGFPAPSMIDTWFSMYKQN